MRYGTENSKKIRIYFTVLAVLFLLPSVAMAAFQIAIDSVDPSIDEGDSGTTTINFYLTTDTLIPSIENVTITYSLSGTATAGGTDFSDSNSGSIIFTDTNNWTPGELKAIAVSVNGDTIAEDNETIVLTLDTATSSNVGNIGSVDSASSSYTIRNDDAMTVSVTADNSGAAEGTAAEFTITLNAAAGVTLQDAVTVDYVTVNGTAEDPGDYAAAGDTVAIPATSGNGWNTTISVATSVDGLVESDESFDFKISNLVSSSPGVTLSATDTVSHTIASEETATVTVTADNSGAAEGTAAVFTIRLDGNPGVTLIEAVTVDYATSGDSAAAPGDYTTTFGRLTIPAGAAAGWNTTTDGTPIGVPTNVDGLVEPDESFEFKISNLVSSIPDVTLSATDTVSHAIDSEESATVSVTADNSGAAEGTVAAFTVTLNATASVWLQDELTVDYATSDDSAGAPGDYGTTFGRITIPAGAGNGWDTTADGTPIGVPTNVDGLVESDESFDFKISNLLSPSLDITLSVTDTVSHIITSGETAAVSVMALNSPAEEGTAAQFELVLSVPGGGSVQDDVTVSYATADGSAEAPGDYASGSGTATIPGGSGDGDKIAIPSVPTVADGDVETDENFTMSISDPDNTDDITISGTATHTLSNVDTATISVRTVNSPAAENSGSAEFELVLEVPGGGSLLHDVTVNYRTQENTATNSDFGPVASDSIVVSAGTADGAVIAFPTPVSIINDLLIEPVETFDVVLSDPDTTDYVAISGSATFSIDSDDTATVSVAALNSPVAENDGSGAVFEVTLVPSAAGVTLQAGTSVDISFATEDDTALGTEDYTPSSSSLTITGTDMSGQVAVALIDDNYVEPDQVFNLRLSPASTPSTTSHDDVTVPADTYAASTIDSEDRTTISLSATTPVAEGDQVTCTVNLTKPFESVTPTVQIGTVGNTATQGADYNPLSTTLDLTPGVTDFTFTVFTIEDDFVEATEDFDAVLSNPDHPDLVIDLLDPGTSDILFDSAGTEERETVTITESDATTVGFTATTTTVDEPLGDGNTVFAALTVELDRHVQGGGSVQVNWETVNGGTATAGDDYVAGSGTLTFAGVPTPGSTLPTQDILITIQNDRLKEGDETFTVNLRDPSSNAVVGNGVILVNILDNDYNVVYDSTASGEITPDPAWTAGTLEPDETLELTLTWNHPDGFENIIETNGATLSSLSPTSPLSGTSILTAIASDMEVFATFRHRLDYTVGANGDLTVSTTGVAGHYDSSDNPRGSSTITGPDSGYLIVDHDSAHTFTMAPYEDLPHTLYCVTDIAEDGVSQTVDPSLTHTTGEVTKDIKTLSVTFQKNPITVRIEPYDEVGNPAIDVGERGQWRVVDSGGNPIHDSDWQDSDAEIGLTCFSDDWKIIFKGLPGWIAPNPIEITSVREYTGTYLPATFALSVSVSGDGAYTVDPVGSGIGGAGTHTYANGDVVDVFPVPDAGATFLRWEVDGSAAGNSSPLSLTMDSDISVIVVFASSGLTDDDGDWYYADDPDPAKRDCDDTNPAVHPDREEDCTTPYDDDCDGVAVGDCGLDDVDNDGDTYSEADGDCDDNNPAIHPGATDDCNNLIDEDCIGGPRECSTPVNCVEIAESPLESEAISPPPAIMFVLDDSGSMDWEFMWEGGSEGKYEGTIRYVFDENSSNKSKDDRHHLRGTDRRDYRTQWHGRNRIYYNPATSYQPWPRWNTLPGTYDNGSLAFNADPDNPRYDPVDKYGTTGAINLDGVFMRIAMSGGTSMSQRIELRGSNDEHAIADTVILVPVDTTKPTLVFDDTDPYFFVDVPEDWEVDNLVGANGGSVLRSPEENSTATWEIYNTEAIDYYVYITNPNYRYADRRVDYTIYYNGGANSQFVNNVNQRANNDPTSDPYLTLLYPNPLRFAASTGPTSYVIRNSHYFVENGGNVYLINLAGSVASGAFQFFLFTDGDNDNFVDDGELSEVTDPAVISAIRPKNADGTDRTYQEERQNFANWFSFYRKRYLAAKAAVGRVIEEMSNARIGYITINGSDHRELHDIDLDSGSDETATLLDNLYDEVDRSGRTPLRMGAYNAGLYFDMSNKNDGVVSITDGNEPWADQADGGGCQRAFAILMTDGYYNGTTDPPVGNEDNDGDSDWDSGEYGDNESNTLADVTMRFYERDLNTSLPNEVQPKGRDTAPHQHMITYGVSFGVKGTIDPAGYPNCPPPCSPDDLDCPDIDCPAWPDPSNYPERIDDLWHASVNGRGKYLNAENPEELVNRLLEVMAGIGGFAATGSSVSINAQELQSGTLVFQGIYKADDWSGDLVAKSIDPSTGAIVKELNADNQLVDKVLWSASDQLEANTFTSRKIVTYDPATPVGAPFTSAGLTSSQLAKLGADATEQQNIINFIRGDDTNEGTLYRERSSMLGDIVHSSPTHVWLDDLPISDPGHQPGFVVVGANDGMVHVFEEDTGNEVFAYIPSLVFDNIKGLASPGYRHKYYVDATAYSETVGGRRLVVGGLGRGGKGYYCLDLTGAEVAGFNAEITASTVVKWEYPLSTDDDMGYGFSDVYIVKSNYSDRSVVVFGNGYESVNGKAVLYILVLTNTGLIDQVVKIDTQVGDPSSNLCNGLSTPLLIDVDLNRTVDYIYAGDLLGNMWKFDLTGDTTGSWEVAFEDSSSTPQPLFTARNVDGAIQPITSKPDVMRHCGTGDGYMVIFGTGRYLGTDDLDDTGTVQTVYGIWDWQDEWAKVSGTGIADKYLGEFTSTRELSNLVNNSDIDGADETVYTVDLSNAKIGDEVIVNTKTFTKAVATIVDQNLFSGASGLADCINDPVHGVPDVMADGSGSLVNLRRASPPAGSLSVTYNGDITLETERVIVGLLQQAVILSDDEYVFLSGREIDWYSPTRNTGRHVGWYFDLAENSERVISDALIRGGMAIVLSAMPSNSPCTSGGSSIIYIVDACTGGQITIPLFDTNGDGRIDTGDLINIGTFANPVWVSPTGFKGDHFWYTPAIVDNMMYFGKSNSEIEEKRFSGEKLGMYYWREWIK